MPRIDEKALEAAWDVYRHHCRDGRSDVVKDIIEAYEAAKPPAPEVAGCNWAADKRFSFADEPGEHDPCYVVMPDGAALPLNHWNDATTDIARAHFIVNACNAALSPTTSEKLVIAIKEMLKHDGRPGSEDYHAMKVYDARENVIALLAEHEKGGKP